jgi:hypothetical protein
MDLVKDVWEKFGPFAALLILFVAYHEIRMSRLWKERLQDKEKEINRVVAERNRLQAIVFPERKTSEDENA